MARLPVHLSVPSAAAESDLHLSFTGRPGSHASSSVISPLALPGALHYFEPASHLSVTSHPSMHANHMDPQVNGGSRDPPRAQPVGFFSPHLTPIPSHAQYQLQFQRQTPQRAASLSPTRRTANRRDGATLGKRQIAVHLPRRAASSSVAVPVDTISGTGSGLITVRRSAIRTISEEMVSDDSTDPILEHEYRRLGDKMRQAWDDERRTLQANRDRAEEVYREAVERLEHEHARKQSLWEDERYRLQTQIMLLQNRLGEMEARGHGASLGGGGLDSRLATFQRASSSQQPRLSVLVPRDSNSTDSSGAMYHGRASKVIDVQEYHRDLEGIHLKENAVKKETFTDTPSSSSGSKSSSGKGSPPHNPEYAKQAARKRSILALKADENSRLTIFAGHTPTVSMSIVATGAGNTGSSSGSNTPTLISGDGDGALSSDGNDNKHESTEPAEPIPTAVDEDQVPAIMEPSDEDPELKGPLTLRNIPAKDEIFLRRLSDKLQRVGSGQDATPTVLKHVDEADEAESSSQAGPSDSDAEGAKEDIPLKFRKTSNFGKPLGTL